MADYTPKIIVVEGRPVYDIRAFYRKEGRAKYISHLDLYRTVQRAFQRAKLPIWFTLGYNPHIYLTYALPLASSSRSSAPRSTRPTTSSARSTPWNFRQNPCPRQS